MENMLLTVALERYATIRLVGRKPGTRKLMARAITEYGKVLKRAPVVGDLTDELLASFAKHRLDEGLSRHTIRQNQSKLLALWNFLAKQGVVKFPTIRPIKAPDNVPHAWTEDELARVFRAARGATGKVGDVPAGLWWDALHSVLWNTGERIEAVMQCRWRDLDLVAGALFVAAEYRKGSRKSMLYRLAPSTIEKLKQFPPAKGLIFKWHLSPRSFYNHYERLLKSEGLPHGRDAKFHCMRKSVASHIKAAGGDATAAMDHSSSAITKAYLDPRICKQVNPIDLLFEV
jgi:integrase